MTAQEAISKKGEGEETTSSARASGVEVALSKESSGELQAKKAPSLGCPQHSGQKFLKTEMPNAKACARPNESGPARNLRSRKQQEFTEDQQDIPRKRRRSSEDEQYDRLIEGVEDLNRKRIRYYEETLEANKQIKLLKDKNKHLENEVARLKAGVRELQAKLARQQIARLKADYSACPPDNEIRDSFKRLQTLWRGWAKNYASDSLQKLDRNQLKEVIAIGRRPKGSDLDQRFEEHLLAAAWGPRILLTAIVAHTVCKAVFASPFFLLGGCSKAHSIRKARFGLDQTLQLCRTSDEKEANAWRAQTLALLKPHLDVVKTPKLSANNNDGIAFYESLSAQIFEKARDLIRDLNENEKKQCENKLYTICVRAGEHACDLSSAKARMEILHRFSRATTFRCDSDSMEAHSTMRLETGVDSRLDGREIDFVCEPFIRAWGNEEGENYDECKVWAKGIVWIPEDLLSRPQSVARELTAPRTQGDQTQHISGQHTEDVSGNRDPQQCVRKGPQTPKRNDDDLVKKRECDSSETVAEGTIGHRNSRSREDTTEILTTKGGCPNDKTAEPSVSPSYARSTDSESFVTCPEGFESTSIQQTTESDTIEVEPVKKSEENGGQSRNTPKPGEAPEVLGQPLQTQEQSGTGERGKHPTPDQDCEPAAKDEQNSSKAIQGAQENPASISHTLEKEERNSLPDSSHEGPCCFDQMEACANQEDASGERAPIL